VAIHRACCSTRQVVANDSVQVMRALATVQNTLGYEIWKPVNDRDDYKTDRESASTPNRTLIFQYDTALAGAVTGVERPAPSPRDDVARRADAAGLRDHRMARLGGGSPDREQTRCRRRR